MQLSEIDPLSPATVENPYAAYEVLRDEAPVHWDPKLETFLVSRYEHVRQVVLDPETFSSAVGAVTAAPPLEAIQIINAGLPPANTLITADPPEHTAYRQVVARVFAPRRVAGLETFLRQVAHELFDEFSGDGQVEFVSRFAVPFPVTVIANQLGVPPDRIPDFKRWSDAWMDFIGGLASPERSLECARQIIECQEYFSERIAQYRSQPRDDMLGVLIGADYAGERPLTEAEINSMLQQFMLAGNETSTATIAATQRHLLDQPDVLESVRKDRSLIPRVIEEVIRLESPVQNIFRVTTRATEIGGVEIPAATRVAVMYGSANRDPRVFPDPERIDPNRPNIREHMAFGHGTHYCIGAGLARAESRIALEISLDRMPGLCFAPGKNDFRHHPIFIARGLRALHLEFDV